MPGGAGFRYKNICGIDELRSLLLVAVIADIKIDRLLAVPVVFKELGSVTYIYRVPARNRSCTKFPFSRFSRNLNFRFYCDQRKRLFQLGRIYRPDEDSGQDCASSENRAS